MIHIMQRCSAGRINKSLQKIIKNINRVVCSSFKILNILKLRLPHIYSSTIIVPMTSTYRLRTSETYCFESSICRFKPPILRDESWKKPQNAKLKMTVLPLPVGADTTMFSSEWKQAGKHSLCKELKYLHAYERNAY